MRRSLSFKRDYCGIPGELEGQIRLLNLNCDLEVYDEIRKQLSRSKNTPFLAQNVRSKRAITVARSRNAENISSSST